MASYAKTRRLYAEHDALFGTRYAEAWDRAVAGDLREIPGLVRAMNLIREPKPAGARGDARYALRVTLRVGAGGQAFANGRRSASFTVPTVQHPEAWLEALREWFARGELG